FVSSAQSESIAYRAPSRFRQVRRRVLKGMAGVFSGPRGTARALRSVLKGPQKWPGVLDMLKSIDPDGRAWGAYGKTGSSVRKVSYQTTVDGRTRQAEVPVANFVLMLLRCRDADLDDDGSLACRRLPPLGEPVRGYVINIWVDGVPKISGGSRSARLLRQTGGRELLRRIVEFEGSRQ
ncbi:MAG: hypothetical protein AAF449_25495, partial [Myxococcota bacterium]